MAKKQSTAPKRIVLTHDEMHALECRVCGIRGTLELLAEAAVDSDMRDRIPWVLDMAVRDMRWVEDMLDPVGLARRRGELASGTCNE